MKAKDWSKERNFNKMRVAGMMTTLRQLRSSASTTNGEAAWLNDALKSLSNIYDRWEKSNVASKKKFLEG